MTAAHRTALVSMLVAALLAAAGVAHAALGDVLEPYQARYEFSRSLLKADYDYSLAKDASSYTVSTVLEPRGIAAMAFEDAAREQARFVTEAGAIVPLSYSRDGGRSGNDGDAEVRFDWERGIADASTSGATMEVPIARGESFDLLTVELAARRALASGIEQPEFSVVEGDEVVRYRYILEGTATIEAGGRSWETVHYRLDRGSSREVHYWFAPDSDYLAIKVEQRARGKLKGTLTLQSLRP